MNLQVAHVYSMKKLVDLEAFIDSTIDHLLERINREIGDTHSGSEYGGYGTANILLNECMSFFAADAVGELAVSHRIMALRLNLFRNS